MRVQSWFVLILSAFASAARGDFVYVSQTRYIYANTAQNYHAPIQESRIDAPDFGPFNQSIHLEQRFPPQIVDVFQNSTLGPQGITFSWEAEPQGSRPSDGGGTPRAITVLDVTFDVTSPQPFHLSGTMLLAYNPGHATFTLTGPGVNIGDDPVPFQNYPTTIYTLDRSGVLESGRYRLVVSVDALPVLVIPYACDAHVAGALGSV